MTQRAIFKAIFKSVYFIRLVISVVRNKIKKIMRRREIVKPAKGRILFAALPISCKVYNLETKLCVLKQFHERL